LWSGKLFVLNFSDFTGKLIVNITGQSLLMQNPQVIAISNLMPPDFVGGYELGAAALLERLRQEQGWQVTTYCGHRQKHLSPKDATADLLGYFPLGWKNHLIMPRLLKQAVAGWRDRQARIHSQAVNHPVFLFNPRRLWAPEWGEWIQRSPAASCYVSDLWPEEYPQCDLFYEILFHNKERLPLPVKLRQRRLQQMYRSAWPQRPSLAPLHAPIFVSDFIRRRTLSAFPEVECEAVIPWGIDVEGFPHLPRDPSLLTTWGFIGRIHQEKGVHEAVEVVGELVRRGKAIRLLIAGDASTSYGRELQKRVAADPVLSGCIEFIGKVSRERIITDFFQRVGVLLFPSLWEEPFAITVLEALSTGLPVIASNRGGTPEIINERTGYLYAPERPGDFLNQALRLLEQPEQAVARGAYGAQLIRQEYTMTEMARRVNQFHREYWKMRGESRMSWLAGG
jgi:glycosyltransferase involved in cell wall biosynthesis